MVGGDYQHQRLGIVLREPQGCREDGRCGVARLRFDQGDARGLLDGGNLFGDDEAEILARDDKRRCKALTLHATHRRLEQALLPHQA